MSDCCSAVDRVARKYKCPVCAGQNSAVPIKTILQHINKPWQWDVKDQEYYFCDNPDCAVVYFAQDSAIIKVNELRTIVGIKAQTKDALICYCFGVSIDEAKQSPEAKVFVIEQTRQHNCACAIRNPSGRCCLKDFPKT